MRLVRMTPGHGDVLLAEGDPKLAEDEERLVREFRRQLELGMWAAVPTPSEAGRHEATMVRDFKEIPEGAERVIFFPPAAGGAGPVAEARARELLGAAAGPEALEMYEQLGFLCVERDGYGYLLYPHRPVVAYDAESGELLNEYCLLFREGDPGERLPDADDVLAKWLALHSDERGLIGTANMDPPGRQLDPAMVRRDLVALAAWTGYRRKGRHQRAIPGGEAEEMAL